MVENTEIIVEFINKMGELNPQTEYKDFGKMRIVQLMATEIRELRAKLKRASDANKMRRELLEMDEMFPIKVL